MPRFTVVGVPDPVVAQGCKPECTPYTNPRGGAGKSQAVSRPGTTSRPGLAARGPSHNLSPSASYELSCLAAEANTERRAP